MGVEVASLCTQVFDREGLLCYHPAGQLEYRLLSREVEGPAL
jgi:hypothetical protein